jgi:hypothetical protein
VNPIDSYDFAISHSLLMDTVWAALFSSAYFLRRRYPRGALVLFAVVLSHWLLDFVSHRPDMALAPGVHRYYGLGLWNSVGGTVLVEGLFWLFAAIVYLRATTAKTRTGAYAFWIVFGLLSAVFGLNFSAPPPTGVAAFAAQGLIFFSLVVAWAYWMNRLRPAMIVTDGPPTNPGDQR